MPAWRDKFAADVARAAKVLVGGIVAVGTREVEAALARAKGAAAAQLLAETDPTPDDDPPPAPKQRARRKQRPRVSKASVAAPSAPRVLTSADIDAVARSRGIDLAAIAVDEQVEVDEPDDAAAEVVQVIPPPLSSRRDRFLAIEASAAARRAGVVTAADRR